MLMRLRHDAVIGGNHEDYDVHAVSPGDHVADEIDVAGDIHDTHDAVVRQFARGEPEINRETALLFFGQRICFAAGEELDEGALPMVDVPGGAEHQVAADGAHAAREERPARAAAISGTCSLVMVRISSRTRSASMRPKMQAGSRRNRFANSVALNPGTERTKVTLGKACTGREPLPR